MQEKVSLQRSDFLTREGVLCRGKVSFLEKVQGTDFLPGKGFLSRKQFPDLEGKVSLPRNGRFSVKEGKVSVRRGKASVPQKKNPRERKVSPMTISDSNCESQIEKLFLKCPKCKTFPGWNIHLF